MSESGADHPAAPESVDLQQAAAGFTSSGLRYLRLLVGLFGLELRETGAQALLLVALAVAFIAACFIAYLFLLVGAAFLLASLLGGSWGATLLGLFVFHVLLAVILFLILRHRARRPLFPGTREAVRHEVEKIS